MIDGQTVLGFDPALGGGTAIIACTVTAEKLYVVDAEVQYGLNKTEELLSLIDKYARKYRPSVVIIEIDAQQKGLGNDDRLHAIAAEVGFEVRPHTTRMNKADEVFGTAQMNRSFIAREVSIPWGDDLSRERMTPLLNQLRAWRPPALSPITGKMMKAPKQDLVMALWFVWKWWYQQVQDLRTNRAPLQMPSRPSWIGRDRRIA